MSENNDRLTVLLVDDEANILLTLERLLMDEEYDIETALSGEDALEKLKTMDQVGLIVSDQRMNGMNGAEFLRLSRDITPYSQRILLTGYSDINATIDAINKGGAHRYLSKPWNDLELIQTLRDSLSQYRQEMEVRRLNEVIQQQNQELETWNQNLKKRILQSTATIREKTQTISSLDVRSPLEAVYRTFDNFFEVVGDRSAVHARTVSTLATDAARKLGLDSEVVAGIRLAGLLHDIGKFGSMANDLHKQQDDMTASETGEYRQHPLRGEQMLARTEEFGEAARYIRGHHEAYNGSGFPDGLKGDAIPLGARLIAIADHLEKSARSVSQHRADYAMMNSRYYAGSLLDPHLLAKFQGIVGIVYYEGNKVTALDEVEIGPEHLVPGMVINRDVESSAGLLLMQKGTVLDIPKVVLIRSHFQRTSTQRGIFIRVVEE